MNQDVNQQPSHMPAYLKSTLRIGAEICIPLVILILILAYTEYRRQASSTLNQIKLTEKYQVDVIRANMKGRLSEAVSNIKLLGSSPICKDMMLHPKNKAVKKLFVDELEVMAQTSDIHDQIRLLSLQGDEVIRINYRNGKTQITPEAQLQNKKHRYYFVEAMKLKPDQIYISEMDLNIEYGKVEVPYVPMVRLATKIFSKDGEALGIAMLNFRADVLCQMFCENKDLVQDQLFLLNPDGYWLAGGRPEKRWGFMFEDKKNISYSNEFPDLWKHLQTHPDSQFMLNGYLVTSKIIDNLVLCPNSDKNDCRYEFINPPKFIIVSQVSPEIISTMISATKVRIAVFTTILSGLLIAITTGMVLFFQQRKFLEAQNLAHAKELEQQSKQLAADIQNMLLLEPVKQKCKYYEFARILKSCHHVGGDFIGYWQFEHAGDILIGDVMGKGVAGALLAAATKIQFANAFRDAFLTQHHLPSPRQIVDYVRDNLSGTLFRLERFVSLNFARLNLDEHTVEFIDCGHTRPILYRKDTDEIIFLEGGNMPLGFDPEDRAIEASYGIKTGDLIMFYSDGVTEARKSYTGELFGINRLVEFVKSNADRSAEEIINELESVISKYQGDNISADDLTCVIVKITTLPEHS